MIAARGQTEVIELSRAAIASEAALLEELRSAWGRRDTPDLLVTVVDQYEENVAQQTALPSQFVERLSLLDRGSRPQEGRTTRSPERARTASAPPLVDRDDMRARAHVARFHALDRERQGDACVTL